MLRSLLTLVLVLCNLSARADEPSTIRSDERVVFFQTAASRSPDKTRWSVPVHLWVFEPTESEFIQRRLLGQLSEAAGTVLTAKSRELFDQRIRGFMVDNERGKNIGIRIAGTRHVLGDSGADGHFAGFIELTDTQVRQHAKDGWLSMEAILPEDSTRRITGKVQLVEPAGVTVISDIDDTVKVSNVTDRQKLLANTFLRPFRVMDGIPALYRKWSGSGAVICFVSSSPWQLYQPLLDWMVAEKFPPTTFELQRVRFKDRSLLKLFGDPLKSKLLRIEPILKRFPGRQFVLVGDSGEKDPEVYGELARRFPAQVTAILIRNVTQERASAARFRIAFESVPEEHWQLFDLVQEIREPEILRRDE
jgi:phosphatidate phosphatase APP1